MNLHLLRMFLAVVEQKGFSRAADVLHVSQSAVSKGVRELEHQIGLQLIEDRRGIRLTEAGAALLPHARSLFALERAAIEEIDDRLRLRRGRLRIGASTTVAGYWLPGAIAALVRQHPGIAVAVTVGNTGDIARAVIDCAVDTGFVEGTIDLPGLHCTRWREDPMALIAPADGAPDGDPTSAGALSRCVWLMREPGSGTRQVMDAFFAAHDIVPAQRVVVGSNEAIVRAIAHGAGVSMLPRCVAEDLLSAGAVRSVHLRGAEPIARPLYRIDFPGRPRSPALDAFLALAQIR